MRVIAGEARGRRLEALPGTEITRPTMDQVKQAMFSIVQFDLPGARVLDLYAGSGQLGIEALRTGAARCEILDETREAMTQAAFDAAAVKRKQSHGDERYRTPEYMRDDLCGSITLFITVLYGKRYRHANAEQDSWEDGIGKSQHVFIDIGVHQPVGDILQSGNVVYKEHEEHGECAEYVYRGNPMEC